MTDPTPKPRWYHSHAGWLRDRASDRGMPALAVGAVSVVRLQFPQGMDGADRRGGGGRGISGHAALVRRWPWFSGGGFNSRIRSLLVLVVVVALPFSWLAVEMKAAKTQQGVADEIRKEGGVVWYDYQVDAHYNWSKTATLPEPPSLRSCLGTTFSRKPKWLTSRAPE